MTFNCEMRSSNNMKINYTFFRLCFAASREGHLLDILSYVHVRRLTPSPGLIFHVSKLMQQTANNKNYIVFCFQSLIAAAMVSYGTIDSLIDFFSFTAWIFYGGSMFALIVMRYTKPNYPRPYKVCITTQLYSIVLLSDLKINKFSGPNHHSIFGFG